MTFSRRPLTVAARLTGTGNRAALEMDGFGTFASGELYNNSYVFIADVVGDRIVDLREYNDSAYSNDMFARNLPPQVLAAFGEMVQRARSAS